MVIHKFANSRVVLSSNFLESRFLVIEEKVGPGLSQVCQVSPKQNFDRHGVLYYMVSYAEGRPLP